jgi:hypothetical protein
MGFSTLFPSMQSKGSALLVLAGFSLLTAAGCLGGAEPTADGVDPERPTEPGEDPSHLRPVLDWNFSDYAGNVALRLEVQSAPSEPKEAGTSAEYGCEVTLTAEGRSDTGFGAWAEWSDGGDDAPTVNTVVGYPVFARAGDTSTTGLSPTSFVWQLGVGPELSPPATFLFVGTGIEPRDTSPEPALAVDIRCSDEVRANLATGTDHIVGFTDGSLESGVGAGSGHVDANVAAEFQRDLPTDEVILRVAETDSGLSAGSLVLDHPNGRADRSFGEGAIDPVRIHSPGGEVALEVDRVDPLPGPRPEGLFGFIAGLEDRSIPVDPPPG